VLGDPVSGVDPWGLWTDTMQNIADRIAFGNRPESYWFIYIYNDIKACNKQMTRVYNGIINICKGLSNAFSKIKNRKSNFSQDISLTWTKMIPEGYKAYKNAPQSVQVCLGVTTFATISPGVVAVGISTYSWAMMNPESAIGILEVANDIFNESMPPSTFYGTLVNIVSNTSQIKDNISNFVNDFAR